MDEVRRKVRLLAESVIRSAESSESVADLPAVAASPTDSLAFVESMVNLLARMHGSIENRIDAALLNFENSYDAMGESTLFLMAALWGIAAHVNGMNDVCDGIDLWITNNMAPRLRSHLMDLALAQSDAAIAAHYKQLAEHK